MARTAQIYLYITTPGGARFEADLPVDMPIARLAADFFEAQGWPLIDYRGRRNRPVAELVNPNNLGETKRLNSESTIAEAGLRDGDTLRVFPESIAGCFVGSTLVRLADGRDVPIASLQLGDAIVGLDTETDRQVRTTILRIFHGYAGQFIEINGRTRVTDSHLFHVNNDWRPARQLRLEDRVTGIAGTAVSIQNLVVRKCEPTPVYNLYLSDPSHCFFADGMLVHNMHAKEAVQSALDEIELAHQLGKFTKAEKDIESIQQKLAFVQQQLVEADSMRRRIEELEWRMSKIGEGFQEFGRFLGEGSQEFEDFREFKRHLGEGFQVFGRDLRKTKFRATEDRAQVDVKIKKELDAFGEEERERLRQGIARESGTSASEITVKDVVDGCVLVTLEMPAEAARSLIEAWMEQRDFFALEGIEQVYMRRLEYSGRKEAIAALPAPEAIKILLLASNPKQTERLRLDEEFRRIDEALRRASFGTRFELEVQLAVSAHNLKDHLLRFKPHIVHFSGHGTAANEIILEAGSGGPRLVSKEKLAQLFRVLRDNIRCVVLNLCFSEAQANAIAEHIDCVVGMTHAIEDDAAISFGESFYQALGYGRSVAVAFDLGKIQIDLDSLNDADEPKLIAKRVDPTTVTFV